MDYTHEQQEVIGCRAQHIAVNAFAGTGKTSTLVGYTRARPDQRILYLAFNASVAAEARTKFPANVDAKTSHSLAFATMGKRYAHKLGNVKAKTLVSLLEARFSQSQMGYERYIFAREALKMVEGYFASGDTGADIPALPSNRVISFRNSRVNPAHLTEAARMIWAAMRDPDNKDVPMPHDGYLKLYQVSGPSLSQYDTILLDEAQDTNPSTLQLVLSQSGCGKVLVGDRYQSIYGFRGAVDAMDKLPGAEQLALTSSFRYGPRTAETANAILATYRGERRRISGLGNDASAIGDSCFVHRTNADLFSNAVSLHRAGKKLSFNGGVRSYQFELLVDYANLDAGLRDQVRDAFVRDFVSLDQAKDYASKVDDLEVLAKIKVVETFGKEIPALVEQLQANDHKPDHADYCLTTAHKSKGLEWDAVAIAEDFPTLMTAAGLPLAKPYLDREEKEVPLAAEEAHLLYVAVTRPRKRLKRNGQLQQLMQWWSSAQGTGESDAKRPRTV